nr:PadR family transcriptional regulator [uncultured Acidovorax sp.]
MKITKTEAIILEQLVAAAGSEMYGLQMVNKSGGTLKMGSVYVLLGRLEDKGLVVSRREENPSSAIPRVLYKVTGAGSKVYRAWMESNDVYERGVQGIFA